MSLGRFIFTQSDVYIVEVVVSSGYGVLTQTWGSSPVLKRQDDISPVLKGWMKSGLPNLGNLPALCFTQTSGNSRCGLPELGHRAMALLVCKLGPLLVLNDSFGATGSINYAH